MSVLVNALLPTRLAGKDLTREKTNGEEIVIVLWVFSRGIKKLGGFLIMSFGSQESTIISNLQVKINPSSL